MEGLRVTCCAVTGATALWLAGPWATPKEPVGQGRQKTEVEVQILAGGGTAPGRV